LDEQLKDSTAKFKVCKAHVFLFSYESFSNRERDRMWLGKKEHGRRETKSLGYIYEVSFLSSKGSNEIRREWMKISPPQTFQISQVSLGSLER